jgi:hypothetical protein
MKRKRVFLAGGVLGLLIGGLIFAALARRDGDSEAYEFLLAEARAEGLPVTAEDIVALLPHVDPTENAAPLYTQLGDSKSRYSPPGLMSSLLIEKDPEAIETAKAHLADHQADLDLLDKATLLPLCVFEGDRSLGYSHLTTEYRNVSAASHLLLLKGAVAAAEDRPSDAIADVRRVLVLGDHMRQEPGDFMAPMGRRLAMRAARAVALWSLATRDERYLEELERLIVELPRPDLKWENATILHDVLALVEASKIREGIRDHLGVDPRDIPWEARALGLFQNSARAKQRIVRSRIDYWRALDKPANERAKLIFELEAELVAGLIAFPAAFHVYMQVIVISLEATDPELEYKAHIVCLKALHRALKQREVPEKIDTSDLLSPFDDQPIEYTFDGAIITIKVGGWKDVLGDPMVFQLP